MKELLVIAGKLADAFGTIGASLKRIADSLEGCNYELHELRETLNAAYKAGWGDPPV